MTQSFRDRSLERLFTTGDTSGVNAQLAQKLRRRLIMVDKA